MEITSIDVSEKAESLKKT